MSTLVKERVIEYVSPGDLKFAPFNPPSRTEKRALLKLKKSIESAGEVIVPLVVTKDNFVADGHRRLTIARDLGFEFVPVIRKDETVSELWSILNMGMLVPNSSTWMQAAYAGLSLENIPDKERRMIEDLRRIVGEKVFESLAQARRSPWILNMAKIVANYCDDSSDRFIKKIIVWFEECQQQFAVRRAMAEGCPAEVLLSAINEQRPIRQYWGIG